MNILNSKKTGKTLGIIGFGAFGQLIALHLHEYFELFAHDPASVPEAVASRHGVCLQTLSVVAQCDVVVIASPGLCCANQLTNGSPLSPDGFIPRLS